LNINPAPLTAKAVDTFRVYGDPNPSTLRIAYTGFVNGENETVITTKPAASTTAVPSSPAATYPINLTGGSAANYSIDRINGTLTVNKAVLSIKADDKQWFDDKLAPVKNDPFYTRTITGFKNGETATSISLGRTDLETMNYLQKPGQYVIKASGTTLPLNANYTITHTNGILYVNDSKAKKITTTLKCVEKLTTPINGFTYRARFLYDNPNTTNVYVPLSSTRNFVQGNGLFDRTNPPPTLFLSTDGGYDLLFDGTLVTWVLVTNSLNSSTLSTSSPSASATSPKCATVSGIAANQLPVGTQLVDEAATKYAVYPNPVSNRLTVTSALQSIKASDISIYDLQGKQYRVAISRQVTANRVELDISTLATGVYMVKLNTGTENKIFRIIKQ